MIIFKRGSFGTYHVPGTSADAYFFIQFNPQSDTVKKVLFFSDDESEHW